MSGSRVVGRIYCVVLEGRGGGYELSRWGWGGGSCEWSQGVRGVMIGPRGGEGLVNEPAGERVL